MYYGMKFKLWTAFMSTIGYDNLDEIYIIPTFDSVLGST